MTTTTQVWKLDDRVHPAPGMFSASVNTADVYRIVKCPTRSNEVNYRAEPVTRPGAPALRAGGWAFVPADGAPAKAVPPVEVVDRFPDVGAIVWVSHPKFQKTDLYVVLGYSRSGGCKLVKLGGENGRYWPSIPAGMVHALPIGLVLEAIRQRFPTLNSTGEKVLE